VAVTIANSAFNHANFGGVATVTISGYVHGGGPLVVFTSSRGAGVSGVTANGTAMAARGSEANDNGVITEGWTLNDIGSFTGNIVVTYTSGEQYIAGVQAFSISGASATPFGTAVTAFNNSSSSPSVTISSASGRLVIACIASRDADVTHTIGSGQTLVREDVASGGGDNDIHIRMVTTTEGGAGSVTMDGTLSAATSWSALGFDIAESGGGGGGGGTEGNHSATRGVSRGVARGVA
jgi:hypothetical protein